MYFITLYFIFNPTYHLISSLLQNIYQIFIQIKYLMDKRFEILIPKV